MALKLLHNTGQWWPSIYFTTRDSGGPQVTSQHRTVVTLNLGQVTSQHRTVVALSLCHYFTTHNCGDLQVTSQRTVVALKFSQHKNLPVTSTKDCDPLVASPHKTGDPHVPSPDKSLSY